MENNQGLMLQQIEASDNLVAAVADNYDAE